MKDAMKSSVQKYLLKPEPPELTLVQAKVPKDLHQEIKHYLHKNHLNWNEFITACLKHFKETELVKK